MNRFKGNRHERNGSEMTGAHGRGYSWDKRSLSENSVESLYSHSLQESQNKRAPLKDPSMGFLTLKQIPGRHASVKKLCLAPKGV